MLAGAAIGAWQYGFSRNYSIYQVDYGKVAKDSLKGSVIGAFSAAGEQAAAKALPPLNFCGKSTLEVAGTVFEHWAVNTVAEGATGMAITFTLGLIDGQSVGEAWDTTVSESESIWTTAALSATYQTVGDAVTAPKCFVAGTMVTTATGLVAIENIQPGDVVLSANEETGEYAYKEVVRTFVNTTDKITHVTISDGEGQTEVIDATPQHPFYVEGKGWVEASALHAGMTIWFANGTKGTVEDISNEGLEEPVTVYNFEVEDFHTYFAGECGVLVHNTCDVTWPNKDHTNKTEGHWDTIQETANSAAAQADVTDVYVNKGLNNVIDNPPHNNRPDVMIVHENGTVDLVEVMSKTDDLPKLRDRLGVNAEYLGDKAGTLTVKTANGTTVWTTAPKG